MEVIHACAGSDQMVRFSLHTTQSLYDRHGRAPERTMARYIANAVAETGFDCEVLYDLPTKNADTNASGCNSDNGYEFGAWSWWSEYLGNGNVPTEHRRKDGDMLLVDDRGGGCTIDGGDVGIAGARGVDQVYEYQTHLEQPDPTWHGRVFAVLHEVGHLLGLGHGHGVARNHDYIGKWYTTPNYPDPGTENPCGEVAEHQSATNDHVLRCEYSDCSAGRIPEVINSGDRVQCGNTDYIYNDDGGGTEPYVEVDVAVSSGTATCDATLHNATIDYWQWQLFDGSGTNIAYKEGDPVTFDLPGADDYLAEAIAKTQSGDWLRGQQSFTYDGSSGGGSEPGLPSVSISVANLHKSNGQIDVMADASDPDGSIASYEWSLRSGGSEVDSNTGNPSELFADGPGQYTISVTVTDDSGNTASASTDLTWSSPPEVSISVANLHDSNGQIDVLAEANDPDGTIESYHWELVRNGSTVDTAGGNNTSLQAPEPGEYTVRVTVTDDGGNTASDSVTRTWNVAPTVSIDSVTVHHESGTVDVAASASDPVDAIATYEWRLSKDGSTIETVTGKTATFTLTQGGGQYSVRVTVSDESGATASETQVFTYEPPSNEKPSVAISNVTTGQGGAVSASADANDPDGSVTSFGWVITNADGAEVDTATGQAVEMQVPEPGEYTISVTVEDDKGARASAAQNFTVEGQPAEAGPIDNRIVLGVAGLAFAGAYLYQRQQG